MKYSKKQPTRIYSKKYAVDPNLINKDPVQQLLGTFPSISEAKEYAKNCLPKGSYVLVQF